MTQPKPLFIEEFHVNKLAVRAFAYEESREQEGKLFAFPAFQGEEIVLAPPRFD